MFPSLYDSSTLTFLDCRLRRYALGCIVTDPTHTGERRADLAHRTRIWTHWRGGAAQRDPFTEPNIASSLTIITYFCFNQTIADARMVEKLKLLPVVGTGCPESFATSHFLRFMSLWLSKHYAVGFPHVTGRKHRCPPESVAVIAAGMTDLVWSVRCRTLCQSQK